jgi:hypothetical protein
LTEHLSVSEHTEAGTVGDSAWSDKEKSLLEACEYAQWALQDWHDGEAPDFEAIISRLEVAAQDFVLWELPHNERHARYVDVARDLAAILGTALGSCGEGGRVEEGLALRASSAMPVGRN